MPNILILSSVYSCKSYAKMDVSLQNTENQFIFYQGHYLPLLIGFFKNVFILLGYTCGSLGSLGI